MPRISLKGLLVASFLSLGLVLMAAYSMISKDYFIRGLDASMAANMEKTARTFLRLVGPEQQRQGQEFSGFYLAKDWQRMPDYVRQSFAQPPTEPALLYKASDGGGFRRPERMVFLMRYDTQEGPLYIARELTPPVKSTVVHATVRQNRQFMLTVSLVVLGFIALISWLLLRHVSRPMAALRAWTHALDRDKLAQPVPDFAYPELNELAELIRTSLSSVQAALERERRFLRHASHELRTPISTIRSNVELQRKLTARQATDEAQQAILDRIDRASLTMQHLTETLLWLNHQPDEPLQAQDVDLARLVRELADEMAYLLTGKPVRTRIVTSPFTCALPLIPARIVLGNLIRNAYQHCWHDSVRIEQHGARIVIRNPVGLENPDDSDLQQQTGYGLGLELTEQLSQRLGWRYHHALRDGVYQAEVEVCPASY
ncbi:sensor histidine kinase [Marinobacter lutaoensis]|uniref:sensor histidine kinase n=1 Tax=Marinobacter lutaoensis TaxID=135739 RepID=UPI0015938129|nr:HAMP domain-containing sensor histidine kinase [Marinobacter lutaoensis]NVD34386.1 HAMP domain-containing histidine kinase [Marinobacter lutaoensis]